MKKLGGAALIAAVIVSVSGCASSGPAPAPSPTASVAERTPSAAPEPLATPTTEPAADVPPQACVEYQAAPSGEVPGGAELTAAAQRATLPPTVVLNPGMQVITSVDEPGMLEAVARVCSTSMTKAELIEVGNAIAMSIKADPINESVAVLKVSGWAPGADGQLAKGDTITTDYQLYTWDPSAAVPLSNNWD